MHYPVDIRTGEFLWRCPQCKAYIHFLDLRALHLAEREGICQGCRAKATFETSPGLMNYFLAFWAYADAWPQSLSWTEAVPVAA